MSGICPHQPAYTGVQCRLVDPIGMLLAMPTRSGSTSGDLCSSQAGYAAMFTADYSIPSSSLHYIVFNGIRESFPNPDAGKRKLAKS